MGACGSSEAGGGGGAAAPGGGVNAATLEAETKISKSIDKLLREEERRLSKEVKMLLLGPGSSGKSTILKQMKVIHLSGFTKDESESYRQQIFRNVMESIQACIAIIHEEELELRSEEAQAAAEEIEGGTPDLRTGQPFPAQHLQPLLTLWRDLTIQSVVSRGDESALPENMTYFYTELPRLFEPGFTPSDQDILRCRQKTTGISETMFKHRDSDLEYRIFDVGGQRSERKKWIHCFENVTAIVFLAAISGYDQSLLEDRDSNQMQEALMLFDSICNSQWFVRTSVILFLNKIDVFKERILVSSIKQYFPDYEGNDTDYQAAKEFFKLKFTKLNRSLSKEIYTNFTTAIDTKLIQVVMASVYDIIVTRNLNDIIL